MLVILFSPFNISANEYCNNLVHYAKTVWVAAAGGTHIDVVDKEIPENVIHYNMTTNIAARIVIYTYESVYNTEKTLEEVTVDINNVCRERHKEFEYFGK